MADTPDRQPAASAPVAVNIADTPATPVMRPYFVPEFNLSVMAASADDAVAKAKKGASAS